MKIVLLACDGETSYIIYNELSRHFHIEHMIVEDELSRITLIRRRMKSLGVWKVIDQILFKLIQPVLGIEARSRRNAIKKEANLNCDESVRNSVKYTHVKSVNSLECKEILMQIQPDLVIVNRTRIITKNILHCTKAVFINIHVGITPAYRGVHGGYWALYNHDIEHCGVTIHIVDEGIDTGKVLYQANITPIKADNFRTYTLLQLVAGIPLLVKAAQDFQNGVLTPQNTNLPSKLYSYPTLSQYIIGRVFRGIK